ncbi:MAG: ribonuclease III [Actinomycetota bacterium]|nr:ribonuclease III [Actinomycetota bacterium]
MPSTTSSSDSEPAAATASDPDPRRELCRLLDYEFSDASLLDLALRHRSWCSENGAVESNERLEFLGDAVLGLVVTDHLYRSVPGTAEGVLARHRSELVSATALAGVARGVELGAALALGKGEQSTGGRAKTSILADGMEAVIGAVYLDGGVGAATTLVLHLLEDRMAEVIDGGLASDHKSRLQELAAHRFGQLPRYVLSEDGPEHEKHFWASVELGGEIWGTGEGRTKKEAEQAAAGDAVVRLEQEPSNHRPPGGGAQRAAQSPRGGNHESGSVTTSTDHEHDRRSPAASQDEGATPETAGTTRGGDHA